MAINLTKPQPEDGLGSANYLGGKPKPAATPGLATPMGTVTTGGTKTNPTTTLAGAMTGGGTPVSAAGTQPLGTQAMNTSTAARPTLNQAAPQTTLTSTAPQSYGALPGASPPMGASPGYAPLTPFGPGNDLVGTQINPAANPRLAGTQGAVDAARQALTGGPDRTALAQQSFADFLAQSQETLNQNARGLAQRNASGGRLGSGMYGSDLTDLGQAAQRDVYREANRLASGLADSTRADQFNTLGALAGLEGQQFGQGVQQRDELRGERGYQYGLSQDAITNATNQRLLEENLTNSQFGREQDRLNTLVNLGYQGNPGGLYLGASGDVQTQANQSGQSAADFLAQYFLNTGTKPSGG